MKEVHESRRDEIRRRLAEFAQTGRNASDEKLWEEMVFCFFTGGCSARMGLNAIEAVRPLLLAGDQAALSKALTGVHRYPNARARYIVASRSFLKEHCGLRLRNKLESFDCRLERRD